MIHDHDEEIVPKSYLDSQEIAPKFIAFVPEYSVMLNAMNSGNLIFNIIGYTGTGAINFGAISWESYKCNFLVVNHEKSSTLDLTGPV